MKDLKTLLEENQKLDGWRISEKAVRSYELFFVHEKLETVRATDTVSADATVYVRHGGRMGDSSFSVYASMTEEDIRKKIETAAGRAELVDNEPYELPEGGVLSAELPTNMGEEDGKALAARIAEAVFAADTEAGGSINALEIFFYRDELHVMNSRGVDKKQIKYRVMLEAIPTFTDEKQSVELYEDYRFTEFDAARITEEMRRRMAEARDRAFAEKPQTPMNISVVLRPQEISSLIRELAYDVNYASVYTHANLHKEGDDLQENGTGDKLTVTMCAAVPGSENSACFDEDGTDLTDICVIRGGIVASSFGAGRFGQYLGVEKPSGALPCVKLESGTLTERELAAEPCLECASMSGLQLDLYNDYIGGEIRLAYLCEGEKKTPVTGISMSARLSEVLKSLRLSEKTTVTGAYEGPEKLLMKNVAIL